MTQIIIKRTLQVIGSLYLAVGLNNLTRQVGELDSSTVTLFLAFASIGFVLGTLIYTLTLKEKKISSVPGFFFIVSGILIIFALSFTGFLSSEKTLFPMWSCEVSSLCGVIIIWVSSLTNIAGLSLFFYASFDIAYLLVGITK